MASGARTRQRLAAWLGARASRLDETQNRLIWMNTIGRTLQFVFACILLAFGSAESAVSEDVPPDEPKLIKKEQLEEYWIPGRVCGFLNWSGYFNVPQKPGYVIVEITIGEQGKIREYEYVEFHRSERWQKAADRLMKDWCYKPAKGNPKMTPVRFVSSFIFADPYTIESETWEIVEDRRLFFEQRMLGGEYGSSDANGDILND